MAKTWSDSENDAIVSDYLVMLEHEQMGRAFNKAEHRRVLMETTGRSNGSVEFKHRSISAVMEALGLPHIEGYRPLRNYQEALFEAVEAHLKEQSNLYRLLTGEAGTLQNSSADSVSGENIVFDEAPPRRETPDPNVPEHIGSIIQRFEHPAERDARNRRLGKAGESLVYEYEKRRLESIGQKDLSDRVRWVARDDGDGHGYDILSFSGKGDEANRELWLEVKTTNGSVVTPFYITRNELRVSEQRADAFRIFRLYDFRRLVRAYFLTPPLERHVSLTPTIYRASF